MKFYRLGALPQSLGNSGTKLSQVMKAIDQARNTQLRALCVRVRKALAATARVSSCARQKPKEPEEPQ